MAIEKQIRNKHKESNENPSNLSLAITPQHQPEVIPIDDEDDDTSLSLGGIFDNHVQKLLVTKESNKNSNPLIGGSDQTGKRVNEVIPVGYGVVQGGPPVPSPSQLARTIDLVSRNPALISAIAKIREVNEKNQSLVGDKLMAFSIPHQQNFPSPHLLHMVVHSDVGSPRFITAYNKIKMELARRQATDQGTPALTVGMKNASAPALAVSEQKQDGKKQDNAETSTIVSRTEKKGKGLLKVYETCPPRRIINPSARVKISVGGSMIISKNNTDAALFKNSRNKQDQVKHSVGCSMISKNNTDAAPLIKNKSVPEQSAVIRPALLRFGVREREGIPKSWASEPIIRKKPAETNSDERQSKKVKRSDVGSCSTSKTLRKQMSKVTIDIGGGPKKTEGYLFSQTESEMNIICLCHGMFLSASEFVAHAGIKDVLTDPMEYMRISEPLPS